MRWKPCNYLILFLLLPACTADPAPEARAGFPVPDSLVQVMTTAAHTGDCSRLHLLCDSAGFTAPDARRICEAAAAPEDFQRAFGGMEAGHVQVQGDSALVPVRTQGQARSLLLIRRGDRWFLLDYR